MVRLVGNERTGRCPACGRARPRRKDAALITHAQRGGGPCLGSGRQAAEDLAVASWLPVLRGLTPHGLRHGLQTWMDEDGIPEVLKTERMGHEMPGMHGVYGHVSPAMRADLKAALQERRGFATRAGPAQPPLHRPGAGQVPGVSATVR